jgi:predicted nucleic acid-binding protein
MASLVVDCSVVLGWLLPDERSPVTARLLDRVTDEGALVPALWPTELANALLVAERRGRITGEQRSAALDEVADLPIAIDERTAALAFSRQASSLAEAHGLTVYDATYLELARRERLPLASLDRALRSAAGRVGVALLPQAL